MPINSQEKTPRSLPPYVIPARIASLFMIALLMVSALWGRRLQREYEELVSIIPFLGLFLLLGVLLLAARYAGVYRRMETRPNWKKVGQVLATTLLLSFCLYLTAEHIISFPIERIHFIKYSLLAFFIYFSFFSQDGSKNYLRSFIVACLLGITEETSQNFIPERFFDWWDILLNCVSCLFGTLFAALTKWWVLALRGNE